MSSLVTSHPDHPFFLFLIICQSHLSSSRKLPCRLLVQNTNLQELMARLRLESNQPREEETEAAAPFPTIRCGRPQIANVGGNSALIDSVSCLTLSSFTSSLSWQSMTQFKLRNRQNVGNLLGLVCPPSFSVNTPMANQALTILTPEDISNSNGAVRKLRGHLSSS